MWNELSNLRPVSFYNCRLQCVCSVTTIIRRYQEVDRTIRFLKGLNELFSVVKLQILLLESLPSLNKVFALVLKYKRSLSTRVSTQNFNSNILHVNKVLTYQRRWQSSRPSVGNNSGGNMKFNFGTSWVTANKRLTCTYYIFIRYTVDKCYNKHGYLPYCTSKSWNISNTN